MLHWHCAGRPGKGPGNAGRGGLFNTVWVCFVRRRAINTLLRLAGCADLCSVRCARGGHRAWRQTALSSPAQAGAARLLPRSRSAARRLRQQTHGRQCWFTQPERRPALHPSLFPAAGPETLLHPTVPGYLRAAGAHAAPDRLHTNYAAGPGKPVNFIDNLSLTPQMHTIWIPPEPCPNLSGENRGHGCSNPRPRWVGLRRERQEGF